VIKNTFGERVQEGPSLILPLQKGWELAPSFTKVAKTSKGPIPPSFSISFAKKRHLLEKIILCLHIIFFEFYIKCYLRPLFTPALIKTVSIP